MIRGMAFAETLIIMGRQPLHRAVEDARSVFVVTLQGQFTLYVPPRPHGCTPNSAR